MQITISARHGQLSEASREKIESKVAKLSRYFERLTAIEVTLDLEHSETPSVEILVSAEHKHDFIATDRSENMWGSVENCVAKMEQQLRKYKEKIQNHRFASPGQIGVETEVSPSGEERPEDTE